MWWRTANQVSQTLANTINDQIVSAVSDELQSITTEARSSLTAVRTLLTEKVLDIARRRKRQFVFLAQLQSQPTISWVAFGWPDGSFFAGHKLGDPGVEMLEIAPERRLRIEQYEYAGNDIRLKDSRVEDTRYRGHRPGVVSRGDDGRRRALVDPDHPSHRRTARRGVCRADRHRPESAPACSPSSSS